MIAVSVALYFYVCNFCVGDTLIGLSNFVHFCLSRIFVVVIFGFT